jgi:hypothetical protein
MKKWISFVAFLMLMTPGIHIYSQDAPYQQGLEPVSLTTDELFVLSNVPELKLPESYKGDAAPLLPYFVDNSITPYFRPITWQSGYECGQSAGICYNFTYEIDRLRQVPANVGNNQYPSHFTWDFLNNANNYTGASFFDSWEIVRMCGNMNVTDYGGGLNTGGYTRWITGYSNYYNGMFNRINGVKAIRVDTPEGLQTLKYWLFDHLNGSAVGGVGNMYAQYFGTPVATFPILTPEAGKYVQTNWGGSPSHSWTICGYNDSVRYDFNGDGQFTNNIDINNDGVVNMKDWELGGIKFANGYAGTGWGNSGFCYTMYKNLADNIGFGGIWNHTIYVLDVKTTCTPKLTMKITLKHTCRNKLKVTVGVNPDISATVPSYIQEYPVFNYQGGSLYMQGGTTEADKTIEFGLDLAPLINQIPANQTARYFLQVNEADPSGADAGEIVNWSLIDYTVNPPVTITYPSVNVTIQNNGLTRLFQNYALFLNKPAITNATLPPAQIYQPYSATLNASGGTPPYKWDAKLEYPEFVSAASFPVATAQQLTLTNNNTGYAIKNLDFEFPFYKKTISKLYVYADGYILFDDQPYTYPFLVDKMLLFRQTSIISPFMTDQTIYPSSGQGVWYEGNSSYAIIRWKSSLSGMQGSTTLNYAVKLYPNGTIEYYYGDMTFPPGTAWTGGLSSGDNKNYQFSGFNNAPSVTLNSLDKFTSCGFPPEMEITEDGHFTGTPTHSYQNLPIKFVVTDNDNISNTKILHFSSFGLLINQSVTSGGDSLIEFGETASMTLNLNNIGTQTFNQLEFYLTTPDPYITLTDSTEYLAVITGGQTLTLADAFSFDVASGIPDMHEFVITLHVQSQGQSFQRPLNFLAHAPVLVLTETNLDDGDNGMLDAGETANLLVSYKNAGSAKVSAVSFALTAGDPDFLVNTANANVDLLKPDSTCILTINLTGGVNAPAEHIFPIAEQITANNGFHLTDTIFLFAGEIVEDFETGDFSKFPWIPGGNNCWYPEANMKYEGNYSSRSGIIQDNMESKISLVVNVLNPGAVSFYKFVSCEEDPSGNHSYDYLSFSVDGFEMARWDGNIPWSREHFWITKGQHVLSWTYHKDYTISAGLDLCLLDFITFPLMEHALPVLSVTPESIDKTLQPGQSVAVPLFISNPGYGFLNFSAIVFDTTAGKKTHWFTDNLTGSAMSCNVSEFTPGQPFSWVLTVINQSPDNESIRHIKLDFPPGVEIQTVTDFVGGSLGNLGYSGTPPSLNWHGETSAGAGVLKPGESASATITGTIPKGFMNDLFMVYDLRGDSTGATPYHQSGSVKVYNIGLTNNWLTLTDATGSLRRLESDTVTANISTAGLSSGQHNCYIIVKDEFNNKKVVPVHLFIPFPVGQETPSPVMGKEVIVRPNPFSDHTMLQYELKEPSQVTVTISTIHGSSVKSWSMKMEEAGLQQLSWDGTGNDGRQLPPGIYLGRISAGNSEGTFKIIRIR